MTSIYTQIYDANLDKEFETILIKLLRFNLAPIVESPIHDFLVEYVAIRVEYWNQIEKCYSFDMAFDRYYQYTKNKCSLIDSLLDNLNFAHCHNPLQNDLSLMMEIQDYKEILE